MSYRGGSLVELAPPLERAVRRAGRDGTQAVGDELRASVRRHTPVAPLAADDPGGRRRGRRPGTLKESWRSEPVSERGDLFGVVVLTHDPVAPYVEFPTRPHLIRPRADRAPASVVETGKPRRMGTDPRARLRFVVRGRVVYAREVHHPGTEGSYMMARALQETAAGWQRTVRRVWVRESHLVWRGA